jgi:hypothetical protein
MPANIGESARVQSVDLWRLIMNGGQIPHCGHHRNRSTGITVAAVVNFVAVGITLIMIVFVFSHVEPSFIDGTDLRWLEWLYLACGVAVSALGIASGVGLLMQREWARKGAIVFIVISFVLARFLQTEILLSISEPIFSRAIEFPKMFMFGMLMHVIAVLWRVPYVIYVTRPNVKVQFA